MSVISYEAVYAELFAVQTGAMELSRTQHVDANINPDKLVYNLENATRQAPFDPSIFTIIRDTKLGLDLLHVNEIQEYLKLKQARCCIMLSNRALWIWLEDKIPSYVSAILTGFYDGQECWLTYLVRDLSALLGEEYPLASFRPGEYGIPTVGLDAVTLDLEDYQQDPRDPSSFRTVVMKGVHDIVAAWLDYPTDGPSYWKAVYVDVIYKSVGVEPLVLDCVWHIYKMMSQKLMGHRKKTPLALDIDTAAYPLFDPESQIRRDLRQLATIVFAFAAGKHGIPDNAVLLGNTPAQHIENVADRRLMAFRVFIEDCYHYCFQGRPTRADGLDDLLDNNGDSYMPFREHGPTRQHMQKAGGPFSPENVRTVEGVFSAVVCRAITFNTEFSRHGRTLFTSPEDFFRAVEDYGCTKVEDYCNPGAYGQHNSRKKAELVSLYWNAINTGTEWPGLKATSPITFTECFEYFYPTSNLSRFPQIGKLGAYLLTADYVYAGIVQAPSSETVSTMIKKINKGPVSAFEVLGMVPQRTKSQHGNKHQTIVKSLSTMLETVHRVVQSSLPEDAHHHIDVDYILTEHALCKFARVVAGKNPVLRIGV